MTKTYYCPRGCNQCSEETVAALGLECANCGCVMTTDSRLYDRAHQRREDREIEEWEAAGCPCWDVKLGKLVKTRE
jgi:hypothetical protein